ncbi:hypothetical protein [Dethiobacter alkaliphilus]|uniref:Uncharacterized protein n=1 Tax=Dethiobacter alkaliphilus AHT 1 TaxID=555088 RepID=C0GCY9_DETAL|nr:hypothetical protein [Dethiobacter alkaliphilus]EEG79074.1 conserved hypothetical protein [Dethiobacter alkaliphilus AHT 1]
MMKDRFSNGFLAGFLAGIVPVVINFSGRALDLTTIVWSDFIALFIFGSMTTEGAAELVFAVSVLTVFLGVLGGIFARYILPSLNSQRHLFKGLLFGTTSWILFFSIPYLFQLPDLDEVALKSAMTNFISASLWGLTMAYILKRIDNKVSQ